VAQRAKAAGIPTFREVAKQVHAEQRTLAELGGTAPL
jgi:hypothetical protein